jgi:G:T-mismatch repair DNA endonuclease (very short patch repair protein)
MEKKRTFLVDEVGYELVEMWECDFMKEISKDSKLQDMATKADIRRLDRLHPRDALYGGFIFSIIPA